MKNQEALSLPEADEAVVQRISGALAELGPLFFPIPMPASYSKEERARYAKAGADFAHHAAMVLAAMPEGRAKKLTDHFVLAILAAVGVRFLAGDAIQRREEEIKRLRTPAGQKGERADQRGDRQNLGATCAKTVGEKSEATQIRRRHRWQHHGPIEYGAGNQGPQATRPRCDPQTCQKTPEPDDWINVRLSPDGCIDVQLCAVANIFKNKFRPYPGAMALDAA